MTPVWVRVIVVAYNSGPYLERAVAGLAAQSCDAFEVVIVDNASTDGSVERLVLPDDRFRLISAGFNMGFASACNRGADGALAPWLALLNPDAVPDIDWLDELRAAVRRHPGAAAFGSTQIMAEDGGVLDGAGDCLSIFGIAWRGGHGHPLPREAQDAPVFSACAAAGLYRRDVWEQLGGMAERFFCYLEDVDLGFRIRLSGYSVIQIGSARVTHAGSATTGRGSAFTVWHSSRNGVYMLVRCMPLPYLALSLPLYVAAQMYLVLVRRMAARHRVAGVVAGLRAVPRLWGERRHVQGQSVLSVASVARLLVWDPRRLRRRAIVHLR